MSSPTSFTMFPKLPPELRLQVWRDAIQSEVTVLDHTYESCVEATISWGRTFAINACSESRQEALRFKDTDDFKKSRTLDISRDILTVKWEDVLWMTKLEPYFFRSTGVPFHFYRQVLGPDVKDKVRCLYISSGIEVIRARSGAFVEGYRDFGVIIMQLLILFPAVEELRIGDLHGRSESLMQRRTVRDVQKEVETLLAKQEGPRFLWNLPSIHFLQLSYSNCNKRRH